MKQYLISTFQYNNWANTKLLEAIVCLPEKGEAVRLFSHMITTQNKWLNRVTPTVDDSAHQWYGTIYAPTALAAKWQESIQQWLSLLESKSEAQLSQDILFTRANDGQKMAVQLKDIALQLNYHSIHHRAQINSIISAQGVPLPATDYILTAIREV